MNFVIEMYISKFMIISYNKITYHLQFGKISLSVTVTVKNSHFLNKF